MLLYCLGAPMNGHNKKFLTAWHRCEGGDADYNPLNTTMPMPGATDYNDAGVKNYRTRRQGNEAHVRTLSLKKYADIVAALQRGNTPYADMAHVVGSSDWGTSESLLKEVLGV